MKKMGDVDECSEDNIIRVRGLPWSASVNDIVKFFDGVNIKGGKDGVHLTLLREGRPSGEAYVELETDDDVELAKKKHFNHMGRRYIEVFRARKSEMEWVVKRNSGSGSMPDDDGVVRLRGLPFGCSKEEIVQFFSGLEIVPNGIFLPIDNHGRHNGEGFVQFLNKEISEKALLKHKERIAHRYIEIFRSNLHELNQASSPKMRGPTMMAGFNRPSPYDSRDRFGGMNRYNPRGRMGFNDFDDGPGWNNNYGGDNWGGRNMGGRGGMGGGMKGSNFGRGGGGGGGGGIGGLGGGLGGGLSSNFNNSTGHCVHMRGLPFSATEMDIADFFLPLNPVNIDIIIDDTDRPSGEADVEFATHDDAVKAMQMDKSNMQHRYIELFLNSTPGGNQGLGPSSMGNNCSNFGPIGGNFGNRGNNFNSNGGFNGPYGGNGDGPPNRMGGNNFNDMGPRMGSRVGGGGGGFSLFNNNNNGGGGGFRGGSDQMRGNNFNDY